MDMVDDELERISLESLDKGAVAQCSRGLPISGIGVGDILFRLGLVLLGRIFFSCFKSAGAALSTSAPLPEPATNKECST